MNYPHDMRQNIGTKNKHYLTDLMEYKIKQAVEAMRKKINQKYFQFNWKEDEPFSFTVSLECDEFHAYYWKCKHDELQKKVERLEKKQNREAALIPPCPTCSEPIEGCVCDKNDCPNCKLPICECSDMCPRCNSIPCKCSDTCPKCADRLDFCRCYGPAPSCRDCGTVNGCNCPKKQLPEPPKIIEIPHFPKSEIDDGCPYCGYIYCMCYRDE